MTHLKRAGLVLVGLLVIVFIVPRVIPVPAIMDSFGFHKVNKEANSELWASLPMQYSNTQVCNDCHQTQYTAWTVAGHRTVSCETCHSAATSHVTGGPPPQVDTSQVLCATCHDRLISRPANFPQVDIVAHAGENKCIVCHNPHDPLQGLPPALPHSTVGRENCQSCHNPAEPLATVPPQVPHTLEGRTNCTDCHTPAGTTSKVIPAIPHTLEGRDNCLLCHNPSSIKPFPQDHVGRTSDTCRTCHKTVNK